MKPILVIQPAYLGDAILTLPLIKALHAQGLKPIHLLARVGTEDIFAHVPQIDRLYIWDKSTLQLWQIFQKLRRIRWQYIFNIHRHFRSGLLTIMLKAEKRIGFDKNPWSFLYDEKIPHRFDGKHEAHRNFQLLQFLGEIPFPSPPWIDIHPSSKVQKLQKGPYWVIAPGSQWETKRLPTPIWNEFIQKAPTDRNLYVVASPKEKTLLQDWISRPNLHFLVGQLSLSEVMALMQKAEWVFTMDSGAAHMATAVAARHIQIYTSTIPQFGFYSLSPVHHILQPDPLPCRPCGIHGKRKCPLGHFRCGWDYTAQKLLNAALAPQPHTDL